MRENSRAGKKFREVVTSFSVGSGNGAQRLRALYRTLELPGVNPLKDAHTALDAAVLAAYGFSAESDLLARILALNESFAAAINSGGPVTAPGVPEGFAEAERLVTEDCIRAVLAMLTVNRTGISRCAVLFCFLFLAVKSKESRLLIQVVAPPATILCELLKVDRTLPGSSFRAE